MIRKQKVRNYVLFCILLAVAFAIINRKELYKWGYKNLGYLQFDIPNIEFSTEPEYIRKLSSVRDSALKRGWLLTDKKDLVPTMITFGGNQLHAEYRLKGDYIEHLEQGKWSYRVVCDGSVLGLDKFSLHQPIRRNNINEFLWQFACKREGILNLKYDLVTVSVNGEDNGLYAIEEHFGKHFCESRKLDGFVLRFEEKDFWKAKSMGKNNDFPLEMDSYNTKLIRQDSAKWKKHEIAERKFLYFKNSAYTVDQVFNYEKLATYLALADLLSGDHAVVWHNMRFYFNPETELLEPIAFDGDLNGEVESLMSDYYADHSNTWKPRATCFRDSVFEAVYFQVLKRISTKSYVKELLTDFAPTKEKYQNILNWEFPWYEFNSDFVNKNAQYIRRRLAAMEKRTPVSTNRD